MKLKPLKHQAKFNSKNYNGSNILVHEGGTGKTVCGCLWLRWRKDGIVVCPKRVVKKWKKALTDWGATAEVVTPDQFVKMIQDRRRPIVIDEADEFASPLFLQKSRSKRTEAMYNYIREYDPETLLLTATPVRSNPWNFHTLLCLSGTYIDWKKWRDEFFMLKTPDDWGFGYLQRPAYIPVPHWRIKVRKYIEEYSDIVLLRDCVKELPPIITEKIDIPTPYFEVTEDAYDFFAKHKWEQQNKAKAILEKGKDFRKVLVVAYYREQIDELAKVLKKDKDTFVLHGGVKDQEAVIEEATASDDCYFIVQASIGAGFDGDTFSSIVFASMSYAVRDFVQMMFRVRRIHNLHPVDQTFLFGGDCDKAVYENVQLGRDFVPSEWDQKLIT